MRFPGKTVMITGGTGALGIVVARRFASEGASLVLPVRNDIQISEIGSTMGAAPDRLLAGIADLADERAVTAIVGSAEKRFGAIDFLINCAGGYAGGKYIEEVSSREWDEMMSMNLKTTFLCCRSVLPGMKRRNSGRIVSIAAAAALSPGSKRGPYQISKRGVIALTETIAEETKGTGVTANAIAPTTILTAANRQSMPTADASRWVPPEEISELAVYLCTDAARFVSGAVLRM